MDRSISVVVPAHREDDRLHMCIDAILTQTSPVREVLIVDDGSSTPIAGFPDSRVRVIRLSRNSGSPALPRWIGTLEATGDWVAFCDSDDVWYPFKIEGQLQEISRRRGIRATASNATRLRRSVTPEPFFKERMPPTVSRQDLIERNWIITSSMLVERSVLLRTGRCHGSPSHLFEDLALWLRVAVFSPVALVEVELLGYRDSPDVSQRSVYGRPGPVLARTLWDGAYWASKNGTPFSRSEKRAALKSVLRQCGADALDHARTSLARTRSKHIS